MYRVTGSSLFILIAMIFIIYPVEGEASGPIASGFSTLKSYEHVEKLTEIGERTAGSQRESEAAGYIYSTLNNYGLVVSSQEFTVERPNIKIHSQNVIAAKEGNSSKTLYVTAHYDSIDGPGAIDNASGVGVLLELARVLSVRDCPVSLVFIAFGAEELGLCGSRYYLSTLEKEGKDNILAVINIDTVGMGHRFEPGYVAEGMKLSQTPFWLLEGAYNTAREMDLPTEMYSSAINGHHLGRKIYGYENGQHKSDHISFLEQGIPAIGITFGPALYWDQGGFLHSKDDALDKINRRNLKAAGEIVLRLVVDIANTTISPPGKSVSVKRYFVADFDGKLYSLKYTVGVSLIVSIILAVSLLIYFLVKAVKRAR